MERPNKLVWLCVETMKLLNEMNLTEKELCKALGHLFPDVYDTPEKCLEQAKNIENKPMLKPYTEKQKKHFDFIKKDMEILKNELTTIGIGVNIEA